MENIKIIFDWLIMDRRSILFKAVDSINSLKMSNLKVLYQDELLPLRASQLILLVHEFN